MPEVSHFAVSLVPAVHNTTAIRNSLYMSFAPIAWDKSVTVSMGEAVDVTRIPTGASPVVGGTKPVVGGGDPNVNGTAGTGGNAGGGGGGPSWHNGYAGAQNGAGGCSVTDVGSDESAGLGGLALMGLGLVAASRRSAHRNGRN